MILYVCIYIYIYIYTHINAHAHLLGEEHHRLQAADGGPRRATNAPSLCYYALVNVIITIFIYDYC